MRELLGIMQGRLTSSGGFFPQKFPWGNWQEEFWAAQGHGIQCIEWMFNAERFWENPIWTDAGRREICGLVQETGVTVSSVCANYFMQYSAANEKNTGEIIGQLSKAAQQVGARQIIIPMFGASEMSDPVLFFQVLKMVLESCSDTELKIGFESDLPAKLQLKVCKEMETDRIGICFDVGNAAGMGRDSAEDASVLSEYLLEVHLKDKPVNGTSVMLGEGAVNFRKVFQNLDNRGMLYILESYFGEDAQGDTVKNIDYIRGKMNA